MDDPTIVEFNKSDPTYMAKLESDGTVSVSLRRYGMSPAPVSEFSDLEAFKQWAFEGGDSV